MDNGYTAFQMLLAWLPFIIIIVFLLGLMRIAGRRNFKMSELAKENSQAVRENTEAVKTLVEELRRKRDA